MGLKELYRSTPELPLQLMTLGADPHRGGVTVHARGVRGAPGTHNPTTAPAVVPAVELEVGWGGGRHKRVNHVGTAHLFIRHALP